MKYGTVKYSNGLVVDITSVKLSDGNIVFISKTYTARFMMDQLPIVPDFPFVIDIRGEYTLYDNDNNIVMIGWASGSDCIFDFACEEDTFNIFVNLTVSNDKRTGEWKRQMMV